METQDYFAIQHTPSDMYDEEIDYGIRYCERCGNHGRTEEIPMMGYSEFLCRKCAAAAYRNEEAV